MSASEIAEVLEGEADADTGPGDVVRVWKENWPSVQVFTRCTWDREVLGEKYLPVGLNMASAVSLLRLLGIPRRKRLQVFDDLLEMQQVALPELQR